MHTNEMAHTRHCTLEYRTTFVRERNPFSCAVRQNVKRVRAIQQIMIYESIITRRRRCFCVSEKMFSGPPLIIQCNIANDAAAPTHSNTHRTNDTQRHTDGDNDDDVRQD